MIFRILKLFFQMPSEDLPSKPKKKKMSQEMTKGSILRLRMTNFMSFDHIEVSLEPGFNVVIGPNGSGKSTIVTAICIALGGHISDLHRQKVRMILRSLPIILKAYFVSSFSTFKISSARIVRLRMPRSFWCFFAIATLRLS